MEKCLYILRPFGIFYGYFWICYDHLVHFVFIWYILCSFGTFFRFWYHVPRKMWRPCKYVRRMYCRIPTSVNK
jgi:hypothetical protein